MTIISDWIEAGITVISDCWSAYTDTETHAYTDENMNHAIGSVDLCNGAHTNTTEGTWRHVKACGSTHLSDSVPPSRHVTSVSRFSSHHSLSRQYLLRTFKHRYSSQRAQLLNRSIKRPLLS
jgi:hypothetical protein